MSLSDLQTRLHAGVGTDGALHLTPAAFPELAEVLGHLRVSGLVLAAPEVGAVADGALAFGGTGDVLGSRGASLRWEVRGDAADQVTLTVPLADGWALEDVFPGLPQSARADDEHAELASLQPSLLYDLRLGQGALNVRKAAGDGAPAGISFTGRARFPAGYHELVALLGVDESLPLRGTAALASGSPADVDVLFPSSLAALEIRTVRVEGTGLHVRTRYAASEADGRTAIEYEGTMRIGATDPLEIDVVASYGMDNGLFTVLAFPAPGTATLARGITAVAEWAGGEKGEFTVPQPLEAALDAFALREVAVLMDTKDGVVRHLSLAVDSTHDWSIVDGMKMTDVRIAWLVLFPFGPERTLRGSVAGTLEFGTATPVRFDVDAQSERGFTVRGALRAGDRIRLTELIETALGFTADLPQFDVDALEIEASSGGDFRLDGSVSSDWGIDIGHRRFAVQSVNFQLQRAGTNTHAYVHGVADVAGSQLYLQAEVTSASGGDAGVEFEGGTLPDQKISLTGVVSWALELFDTSLPSGVPDITLSNLLLRFNTASKEFHFQGETDAPLEVPFLAGDGSRIHAAVDLTSTVDGTGKRVLQGWMEGDLVIGASTFRLRYELGQESHVFRAWWALAEGAQPLGIDTLLDTIGAEAAEIPAGVDLNLTRVYFEYQAELGTFTLVADSATYGEAFLLATRPPDTQSGGWTYVFGLEYKSAKLSQVPVLGSALGAADLFSFQELGILVASADVAKFTVPTLPPMQAGDGAAPAPRTAVASGTAAPLAKGISFIGVIGLSASGGTGAVAGLRKVLPGDTLTITAAYDATASEFKLTGILDGAVTIPTGGSSDLRIGNAEIQLQFPDLVFTLLGTLDFTLDHQPVSVTPSLSITEDSVEARVAGAMPGGWHAPMGIQGLTLDEVDLEVGVIFLPAPGVNLGLEGQFHVGDAPADANNQDQFAFVLEIVEEVPNPLLLSFGIAEITVRQALLWFAPGVPADDLPDFLNQVKFSDVSFFWAESEVLMPDGTMARPGLRYRGTLQVFGTAAHAAISIDSSGLSGEIMLSPLHLGSVLSVTGAGQGVYRNEVGGKAVPVTVGPSKTGDAQRVQLVAPGGPVVQFRTRQSPYLYASIDVSLFGAASAGVEAVVSDEGVHFKVVVAITDAVSAEVECTTSKSGFAASARFGLHLKAELGPVRIAGVDLGTIDLDAGFDLEMGVQATADDFTLHLGGDFDFEGARLSFPTLTLDVAPASLAELPARLIRHLEENVETIFADLFNEAARVLEDAGKAVAAAAEAAAAEVAQIGAAAVEEAEKVTKDAEQAVAHAGEAVAKEAERVEQEAEQITQAAAAEVAQIGQAAAQEVERIGGEIAQVATAAAHEVEAIGREIGQEAQQVEQAVAQLAEQTAQQVQAIAHAVEAEVQQIVGDAQRVAADIAGAARAVADELGRQAQALWGEARQIANEIAEAARKAEEALESAARSAWHAIKKY